MSKALLCHGICRTIAMKSLPVFRAGLVALATLAASSAWMSGQAHPAYIVFDPPDADHSAYSGTYAISVNKKGQVAGYFDSQDQALKKGFLRNPDGSYVEFNPPNAVDTYVRHINNKGDTVGFYATDAAGTNLHGFVRTAEGILTTFDAPGSNNFTKIIDINEQGVMVGSSNSASYSAFLTTNDGQFTSVAPPEALSAIACGINNSGQVGGVFWDKNRVRHYFVRGTDGQFSEFDLPFEGSVDLLSGGCLDASGDIAGWYHDDTFHSYMRKADGEIILLDPPNSPESKVNGLSPHGVAVGAYRGSHWYLGFLRQPDGTFRRIKRLPDSTAFITYGVSSDACYVVGNFTDPQRAIHGYLWLK